MRYYLLSLLPALLFVVQSQAQGERLQINRLKGDLYVYTTWGNADGQPYPSNSMYVVTSRGVVLFDTPWDTTQAAPLLDSIWNRHHKEVILSISTHFHEDRTAGLGFLARKGVQTYCSRLTRELCRKYGKEEAMYVFDNDTTFTVGNYRFETFYPGKGHSPDNIVIWIESEKLLYGGCFVKSTETNSIGNLSDASIDEWPASIRKVMQRYSRPAFVIPGHLGWTDRNSLSHTLKILKKTTTD